MYSLVNIHTLTYWIPNNSRKHSLPGGSLLTPATYIIENTINSFPILFRAWTGSKYTWLPGGPRLTLASYLIEFRITLEKHSLPSGSLLTRLLTLLRAHIKLFSDLFRARNGSEYTWLKYWQALWCALSPMKVARRLAILLFHAPIDLRIWNGYSD